MASVQQIQALKESLLKQINTAFAPLLTEAADAAGDDAEAEHEEAKLTPRQKLEKQLETANEKLTKLNEKIAGGKSKIPDKDAENKTKFEEVISKINEKISELDAKEAAKAAPKPAKAAAKKTEEKPEVKKHVPRITPAMTTQLKDAVETAGATWDDKYKKEFVTQVNALDDKQFGATNLEGHMAHFASQHRPAALGGGGGTPAPKLHVIAVPELAKQARDLTQLSPGVFQNKTSGLTVTGPNEDSEEEFEDYELDEETYVVGQNTGRVYKTVDGVDEFVGFQYRNGSKVTNLGSW